jgi:hydrogenase-4 component E
MTGIAGAAALLLSVALLCVRRTGTAVLLCALQALVAAASLGEAAPSIALCAALLNGVALPLAAARLSGGAVATVRGNRIVSGGVTLTLVTAAGTIFARVAAGGLSAVGVSVTLLGLWLLVVRSDALAPAVGLLSSQNGLVLIAGVHPDLSLPAALAAAVPLVPGLVLADRWLRR